MGRISNLIYFNKNQAGTGGGTVPSAIPATDSLSTGELSALLEATRRDLAALTGAEPPEIWFSTGADSAARRSLKFLCEQLLPKGGHVITHAGEDPGVLEVLRSLRQSGMELSLLEVDREGRTDPEALARAIRPSTALVCIRAANPDTGVIQPLEEIAAVCQSRGVFFFSDASSFIGSMRCDVRELGLRAFSFEAGNLGGPAGTGGLFIHQEEKQLSAALRATDQSSLLSPALLSSLGSAARLCRDQYWETGALVSRLRNYLEHQLLDLEGLRINGSTRHRLADTSNLTFPEADKIRALQQQFCFGSYPDGQSEILSAMGLSSEEISRSFCFSFGRENTLEEVQQLVQAIMR